MQRPTMNVLGVFCHVMSWLVLALMLLTVPWGLVGCQQAPEPASESGTVAANTGTVANPSKSGVALPRLLDLGADKCIPCKMMAPILEELKQEYAGSLEVVFIDVWQDTKVGAKYGIQSIPTQIFYDASGKEVFRHEGFFSKEDILAKWKELGVDLPQPSSLPSLER